VRLEDLPGIKPHLITRLKRRGAETVFDLAASSPLELVEKFIIEKFEERIIAIENQQQEIKRAPQTE
jgi:hypothetical protein